MWAIIVVMQPNPDTLKFIRQITEDGILTDEEVWSLGTFLNEHADAQKNWPGNILFEILKHVFDDGILDPHEIEAVGHYLRGIELQCSFTQREENVPVLELPSDLKFEVIDFRLPVIEHKFKVLPTMQFEKEHEVDLLKHECDCAEFSFKRQFLPNGSLGRACKHMVTALDMPEVSVQIPKLEWNAKLFDLIRSHSQMNRSLDPMPSWKLLKAEAFECVVSWGDQEWCRVYADTPEGSLERFGYHLTEDRWSYGATPPGVSAVTKYLTDPNALNGG
ncbi:MAG: hypothetical protein ACPGVU_24915 [Limisphaerales bacterium]